MAQDSRYYIRSGEQSTLRHVIRDNGTGLGVDRGRLLSASSDIIHPTGDPRSRWK